jgi:hypothetical protein
MYIKMLNFDQKNCLYSHGMGSSVICGLTADKMKKEAHLFTAKLEGIMKKEKIGHNCAILKLTGNLSFISGR